LALQKKITIIHVSDLHISDKDFANQSIVLNALWKDLREQRRTGLSFDLALFTGDLIGKGAYTPNNVRLAKDQFVAPLLAASGLSSDRLFIVPGNHDVQVENRSPYLAPVFASLTSEDLVQQYLINSEKEPLKSGLEAFNELRDSLGLATPAFRHSHYAAYTCDIHGAKVGICAINSAWKASGKPNDVDCGKLIVGRHQIDELARHVEGCELRFGLFHHPVNYLAPFDNGPVQRQLALHFDAVFFGHNHDGDGMAIAGTSGTFFASNAACVYQYRDDPNGYSIVSFDAEKSEWTVSAREYFESRQQFDDSTRFAPQGRKTFLVSRRGSSQLLRFPTQEFTQAVTETIDGHLISSVVSKVAPKSLRSIFVEPPLSRTSQRQMSAGRTDAAEHLHIGLRDILASGSAVFFVGSKESGKTTLLHRICSQGGEINLIGFPPFVVYVDMNNSVDTRAKILGAIVEFSGGSYRRQDFIDLLNNGLIAVCFDNFDTEQEVQRRVLEEFTGEFGKCRYFFTIRENLEASVSSTMIPTLGLKSEVVYLHSFSRKETRALTKHWFGELDSGTEKVDEILSVLQRLNIPRTPFLISAMLWIKETQVVFSPVNKAAIIDAFIDGVFDKFSESKERSGLDTTNKRHFLAAFAEHLSTGKVRRVPVADLDQFTVDYFRKRTLNIPSGPFISELKSRGILIEVAGFVGFKFDCIRAFFLAVRFRESDTLLDAALSQDQILDFGEELDYFTGMIRDRADVLSRMTELLKRMHREANLGIDLSYFDDVAVSHSLISQERREELTEKILGSRVDGEKREQLLDRLDSQSSRRISNAPNEPAKMSSQDPGRRFMGCLQIASAILRNSELVEDPDLKLDAYETITGYWCEVIIGVLIAVEFLEDDPKSSEVFADLFPAERHGLATYFLKMLAPIVVMCVTLESLGTAKLQLIMEQCLKAPQPIAKQVLNTFLYVDLNFRERFKFVAELLDQHKGNRFVAELIFLKIAGIFGYARLTDKEESEVKTLLARSIDVVLTADSHKEKNRLKNRVLADIEKRRLTQSKSPSSQSS
jgi:predicted MPP superfamily phosphohydrolase